MALRGTSVCQAVSSAQAAQTRWEAPQIPQARGVTMSPACGSLPRRMTSRPRNSSACVHALTTRPSAISTRTSRSPSTRPTGEMSRVWLAMCSDHEDVVFDPTRRGRLRGGGKFNVADLIDAGRQCLRHAHQGLRFEDRSGCEIMKRKLRFRAAEAGHAGSGLRGLPVPKDPIARRVSHWPAATEIVEQAAFTLAERGRRNLIRKMHIPRAAGLGEAAEERFRPLEIVERQIGFPSRRQRDDNLRHPIRVRRAARNVDHRQTRSRAVVFAKKAAMRALKELKSDAVGWIRRGRRN